MMKSKNENTRIEYLVNKMQNNQNPNQNQALLEQQLFQFQDMMKNISN